jgi:hypothetical protein
MPVRRRARRRVGDVNFHQLAEDINERHPLSASSLEFGVGWTFA